VLVAIPAQPAAALNSDASVKDHRPELDVVRFLAFLLVFFHHVYPRIYVQEHLGEFIAVLGHSGLRVFMSCANACGMGLCLFFTLSAYLITDLLLKERSKFQAISIRKFYIRRMLRIWPLYGVGVTIGLALAAMGHHASDVTRFEWYLLFVGNIYCAAHGWSGNPMTLLWSISVEEQFYLVWPWAMRWLSIRNLAICAGCFIAAANAALFILGERAAATDFTIWANSFVQLEMFAVGILLALAKKSIAGLSAWLGYLMIFAGPVLWFGACFLFRIKPPAEGSESVTSFALMLGFGLGALGCASVLHGFCVVGPSCMPRWASSLGKISYGLYVWHLFMLVVARGFISSLAGSVPLALGLTILTAQLSYSLIERPFLRLKSRFEVLHSSVV